MAGNPRNARPCRDHGGYRCRCRHDGDGDGEEEEEKGGGILDAAPGLVVNGRGGGEMILMGRRRRRAGGDDCADAWTHAGERADRRCFVWLGGVCSFHWLVSMPRV